MKLDRPTHIQKSNRSSGWMSEFTEEIPGQLAAIINKLGDGRYTYTSIYPLPSDAQYDETVYPDEWIQATGIAPDRLTVEIRRLDPDNTFRVYTIGHSEASEQSSETEPIRNGDNTYLVGRAEVLTAPEAIELFQHYYDHHAVPSGWNLREQAEFATPADGEAAPDQPAASLSEDSRTPSAVSAKARSAPQADAAADQQRSRRKQGRGE